MDRPEHQRILEEFEFIADEMQIRENRRDRAYCEALCARYAMLLWEARNDDLLASRRSERDYRRATRSAFSGLGAPDPHLRLQATCQQSPGGGYRAVQAYSPPRGARAPTPRRVAAEA